jgi:hypothetical protein
MPFPAPRSHPRLLPRTPIARQIARSGHNVINLEKKEKKKRIIRKRNPNPVKIISHIRNAMLHKFVIPATAINVKKHSREKKGGCG